jgi:DNA-binding transcriptional ArsR family regulator
MGSSRIKLEATSRWLKAMWHPTQVKALTILTERAASPKEIAAEIGEPVVGNVSYHVKALADRGLVDLVNTKQRRGATEHFYRSTVVPAYASEEWPLDKREQITKLILQLFFHDVSEAIEAKTLDRFPQRHMSRTPLQLDEAGFLELAEEQDRFLERIHEIQARSDGRRMKSGEEGWRVRALLTCFTMPPGRGLFDRSTTPRSKTDD